MQNRDTHLGVIIEYACVYTGGEEEEWRQRAWRHSTDLFGENKKINNFYLYLFFFSISPGKKKQFNPVKCRFQMNEATFA